MQARAMLQTLGTVLSLTLAIITLRVTNNIFEIDVRNLTEFFSNYALLVLPFITIVLMILTGFSYYNSREEHEGGARFLYLMVAIAHVLIAPIALIIGSLRIQFGQYWWAVLIGILILIYWGSQQKESQ